MISLQLYKRTILLSRNIFSCILKGKGGLEMENRMSKAKDIEVLAYKIKEKLKDQVSINTFGFPQEVLCAKYAEKGKYVSLDGIWFYVKYSANDFLRLQMDDNSKRSKKALRELTTAISEIQRDNGERIGLPLATYTTCMSEKERIPTAEWAFCNREEYAQVLQDGILFDDGAWIEDLEFTHNEKQKVKQKKK